MGTLRLLASEGPTEVVQASGWFLENAWIIPALPALSFVLILFFGKRMPKGGSGIGIAAVGLAFVFATITAGQWIDQRDAAEDGGDEHGEVEEAGGVVGDSATGIRTLAAPVPAPATGGTSIAMAAEDEGGEGAEGEAGEEGGHEAEVGVGAVIETFTWWESGGRAFELGIMVDGLTVMMLFMVSAIALLVHIYSTDYVAGDIRYTHFFAFLSLFTASMLFFVLSENTLQMIVGWELVGVCSFVLIGHWWEEQANSNAALKAFITNRVGDMGLLIGMIILFWQAGTWSITSINEQAIAGEMSHTALVVAATCLTFAVMSKSGQFILHVWLPDAMAGPTPVSALIHAATMVVAGIYMVSRLYGVFFVGFSIGGSSINFLTVVGVVTLIFGGLLAFVQDDIKKVLAYSTVSQLGYMVMALGVGAWTAAVFHLFTHAFFKAGLFLGSGSVSHSVHSFDMKKDMGGLRKDMPITFWTFIVCSLALVGVFPFAGFWSKDEILVGTGGWGVFGGTGGNGAYTFALVMGIVGAALTGAYMTRTIYLTFFGEFRGHGHPHESGPRITVPLIILATMAVLAGFTNLPAGFITGDEADWQERFGHYVEPVATYFPGISHGTPSYSLAIFSSLIALSGVALAYYYYFVRVKAESPVATELANGPVNRSRVARGGYTVLKNKYYFDWLYEDVIVDTTKGPIADGTYWTNQEIIDRAVDEAGIQSVNAAGFVYREIDQGVIDRVVNLSGQASEEAGQELRQMQTGKIQQYAAIMFAAATILAGLFILFV